MTKLVWEHAPELEGSELVVLLALADWATDAGQCWPSMQRLAEKARISIRNAQYLVKSLAERGFLAIEQGRGRGHTSQFLINLERLRRAERVQCVALFNKERVQPTAPFSPKIEQEKVQSSVEKVQTSVKNATDTLIKDPLVKDPLVNPPAAKKKNTETERARPLPQDFEISPELRQWAGLKCREHNAAINIPLLADKFVNYYRAGPGQGKLQKSWDGTWRQWVLTEIGRASENGKTGNVQTNGTGGNGRVPTTEDDKASEGLRRRKEAMERLHAAKGA